MAASRAPAPTLERAILVTGIPFVTDDVKLLKDTLNEYFGGSRCGGGDIENVICPFGGKLAEAIVIFNSEEVPKTVIEYGVHIFEEQTINVQTLPSVFTHIDVEVDRYYWDIIPRDNAALLVSSLKATVGDKNVSGEKHVIDTLTGSLDQLKEIKHTILASAGIVSSYTAGIIAKSIEVNSIPFVTDDEEELKNYVIDDITCNRTVKVEQVITRVKGNIQRAIIVFESTEDKEKYVEQSNHRLRELSIKILPKVYRNATATLDDFYISRISGLKIKALHTTIKEKCGLDLTLHDKHLSGAFEQLTGAMNIWLETMGLSPTTRSNKSEEAEESKSTVQPLHYVEPESWVQVQHEDMKDSIKLHMVNKTPGNSPNTTGVDDKMVAANHQVSNEGMLTQSILGKCKQMRLAANFNNSQTPPDAPIQMTDNIIKANSNVEKSVAESKSHSMDNMKTADYPKSDKVAALNTDLSNQAKDYLMEVSSDQIKPIDVVAADKARQILYSHNLDMAPGEIFALKTNPSGTIAESQNGLDEAKTSAQYTTNNVTETTKSINSDSMTEVKPITTPNPTKDSSKSEDLKLKKVNVNETSTDPPAEAASVEVTHLEHHTMENYVSVDAITFEYIMKTASDKLNQISQKYKVTIDLQTPDCHKLTEQMAHFNNQNEENMVKSSDDNISDAMEEFIKLYQDVFYSVKRVPLKYDNLSDERISKALRITEKQVTNIVIYKNKHEFIFCGADNLVAEAVKVFRETAGIKPITRRLRHNVGDSVTCEPSPEPTKGGIEQTKGEMSTRSPPGNIASVFYTNEGLEIVILEADITKQKADIIVNAANGQLQHSGGVALAISRAAGKQLQSDCDQIMKRRHQDLRVRECIETKGYNLHCQNIIHAVGPVFEKYGDRNSFFMDLVGTFMNVLNLANKIHGQTIAIPLISSGNFGGPKKCCTGALANALCNFSSSPESKALKQVFLVNVDNSTTRALQQQLAEVFPTRNEIEDTHTESHDFNQPKNNAVFKFKTDERIEVFVVKGDITRGKVEVIVNAANGQLRHGGGVAGAIARAAGNEIRNESSQIIRKRGSPLQVGECVMTGGYNLKCKVIHAVGPIFQKCQSEEVFFKLLKKTFLQAIRFANLPVEAKHVAIPLISSGIYGGPKNICAKALAEAVKDFSASERNLIIRRLYLVNIDDETTEAVRMAIERLFSMDSVVEPIDITVSPDSTDCDKEERVDGMYLTPNHKLKVSVLLGDITKQNADVIVNPSTPTLQHTGKVAKVISDAAGYKLQNHCDYIISERRKGKPLNSGDTQVTDGFGLSCKKIIHTVGPTFTAAGRKFFPLSLKNTFLSCLKCANSTIEGVSVALPIIESDKGPKDVCAEALANAIDDFDKSEHKISLKSIIVIASDETSYLEVQKVVDARFGPPVPETVVSEPLAAAESKEDNIQAKYLEYTFKAAETLEIIALTGDISVQSADVLVNNTDSKLNNSGDISQRLSKAAGPEFNKECKKLMKKRKGASFKSGEFVSTEGFELLCKAVTEKSYGATGATGMVTQQSLESKEKTQMTTTIRHQDKTQYDQNVDGLSTGSKNNVNSTSATHNMSRTRQTRGCQTFQVQKKELHPLESCQHKYCLTCIRDIVTPANACQVCLALYGAVTEEHLNGTMTYYVQKDVTPKGSKTPGVICMKYDIPYGVQKANYPRPGCEYHGLKIRAYLPTNTEGHEVLWLLKEAFLGGHLFQINSSRNSKGRPTEQVALADIQLKTELSGGIKNNGYPDQDYLPTIKKILQEKGIKVTDGSVV